jgi:hypothetical protein
VPCEPRLVPRLDHKYDTTVNPQQCGWRVWHGALRVACATYVHADGRSKHYATTNAGEYWAEGVQWWFFSNYGECFAGNVKVETAEEFAAFGRSTARSLDR